MEDGISLEDILQVTTLERILEDCGATKIKHKGSYYICSSPFHEDKTPSFTMYKDTGHWEDFSGEVPRGSIGSFIRKAKGISLREYLGISKQCVMTNLWTEKKKEREIIKREDYRPEDYDLIIEGDIKIGVENLKANRDAWIYVTRKRHMTPEFIEHFNIGIADKYTKIYIQRKDNYIDDPIKTDFSNRICIPIIENNILASMEGRTLSTDPEIKKCIYPASVGGVGGSTYRRLFNYSELNTEEPLIVCEGIMDLPTIWSYISKNCTCTYGSALKAQHKEDLLKFKEIILMSDSDEGGERMIDSWRDFFTEKEFNVARLPKGQDPGESSIDEIKRALDNQMSATRWVLKRNHNIH